MSRKQEKLRTTDRVTNITVVEKDDGAKGLVCDGSALPETTVSRSSTLRDLLDVEGDAALPLQPHFFRLWCAFSARQAYSVADLAGIMEVAAFLCDKPACEFAAKRLGVGFRKAYRHDLQATAARIPGESMTFPDDIPASPGRHLQAAIATLPHLAPLSLSSLLPHLTLCEALVLPAPFPAMAVQHYIANSQGTLDLSPPRVPAFTPRVFLRLCKLLSPLLPSTPPIQALHIPAPCLRSTETFSPLATALASLTRLCITHGKATYGELGSRRGLPCGVVVAILHRLSPASLRHLSITGPLKAAHGDPDICCLLGGFTALTYLHMPVQPLRPQNFYPQLEPLRCLSALRTLSLTHIPPEHHEIPPVYDTIPLPSGLQRFHACGSRPDIPRPAYSRTTPNPDRIRQASCPRLAELRLFGTADVMMSFFKPHLSTARGSLTTLRSFFCSLMYRSDYQLPDVAGLGVSNMHFPAFEPPDKPHLHTTWQFQTDNSEGLLQMFPWARPLPVTAQQVRVMTFVMFQANDWSHGETGGLVLSAALRGMPRCATLCVLYAMDLPPYSPVFCVTAGVLTGELDTSRGWVSQTREGVSHPICALNMLQQAEGGTDDGGEDPVNAGVAAGAGQEAEAAERSDTLHTLRVSRDMFKDHIQSLVEAGGGRLLSLTDLAVLCGRCTEVAPAPGLDLGCVSRLTGLRTLALEGVPGLGGVAERLAPLARLTALRLQGTESEGDVLRQFGGYLRALSGLDRLDLEVDFRCAGRGGISPPSDTGEGGESVPVAEDSGGESEDETLKAAFWVAVRGALRELPLQLGAWVALDMVAADPHPDPSAWGASTTSLCEDFDVDF